MNMTSRQIDLVRSSFALLKPKAQVAALAFYQKLFTLDPGLRKLFRADIETQADKLMTMLASAVGLLGQPQTLEPVLLNLGRRHVDYGVRPEHYTTVGSALLWSLGATLGPEFNPETQDAWGTLYTNISETMQRGESQARQDTAGAHGTTLSV